MIVAESAPFYGGQEMAARLAEKGIDVTVIADAAAFALMPRVDKVSNLDRHPSLTLEPSPYSHVACR